MKFCKRSNLLIIVTSLFLSSNANAAKVHGTFSGTVTTSTGYGFTGTIDNGTVGTGIFGENANGGTFSNPNVGDVNGATVSGEFYYDTDLVPSAVSSFDYGANYSSLQDTNDWLALSITINGITITSNGSDFQQVLNVRDEIHVPPVFPDASGAQDMLQMLEYTVASTNDGINRVVDNVSIVMEMHEFVNDIFYTGIVAEPPTDFIQDWTVGTTNTSSGLVSYAEGTYDLTRFTEVQSGEFPFSEYYQSAGTFSIDSVSFSVVPVPAAAWLFGSGLLGLIGVARRKKS